VRRSESYFPDWDIKLAEGDIGESLVASILTGTIEVKRKSYRDTKLYVELEHDPGRTGNYIPSGLNNNTADNWAFVVDDTRVVVFVPADRLRRYIDAGKGVPKEETDGDCPTRGILVDLGLLLSPKFN
jgi:hypothetical protein